MNVTPPANWPDLSRARRAAALGLALLLVLTPPQVCRAQGAAGKLPADEDAPLPKLDEMKLPTAEQLLRERPRDWLVLLNQDVVVVEPLAPRPGALEFRKEKLESWKKSKPSDVGPETRTKALAEFERLPITLLEGGGAEVEYQIETRFIERVIYFEELILQRIDKLLDDRNVPLAYDLFILLDRRQHGWPDSTRRYYRLLGVQAEEALRRQQPEMALVTLEQLYPLAPEYPHMGSLLAQAIEPLVNASVHDGDFRRARHFLARLARLNPQHAAVPKWRDDLQARAQQALFKAREVSGQGRHREALDEVELAARIWPDLAGLKEAHRALVDRYQTLRVGIWEPPDNPADPFPGRTAERRSLLGTVSLFEPDRLIDGVVRYRSPFFETWEPADLGREWRFLLRPRRAVWETRPVLSAGVIAEMLQERGDPASPRFDERWQGDVASIWAPSPGELRLSLHHIPLKIEASLRAPVALPEQARAWNSDAAVADPTQQRFRIASQTSDEIVLVRTRLEPADVRTRHLTEIRERVYPHWDRALQALLRGDIDAVSTAEFRDIRALQADTRFFTLPYALPRTHIVLIHPQSPLAKSSPLRRALLLALPREQLLKSRVLEGADESLGRLVTGPFARASYGAPQQLTPPVFNATIAAALVATAKKEFDGTLPALRITAPSEPALRRALPDMLDAWKRVGFDVELADGDSPPESWDLACRSLRLTEPVVEFWPLLSPQGKADLAAIAPFPHPVREQLLELERTVDWTAAVRHLHRLQQEFLAEARYLPLWEVDEYFVIRRRAGGLQPRPMHAYDDAERWTVQSWYPTETP